MIFLKKLSRRQAVFKKQSGQITVFLALSFLVFLGLFLLCCQSVMKQFQRQQAEQATEAGMFSLFSEYEPHLLEQYDLFYLDTSFGNSSEKEDEICSHIWHFVDNAITGLTGEPLYGLNLQGVNVKNFVRATDGNGAVFYRQAIQIMKERIGLDLVEDWLKQEELYQTMKENADAYQADYEEYEGSVRNYEDEEEELDSDIWQWDGLTESFTLSTAVPKDYKVSEKAVNLEVTPSHRELSVGSGRADGTEAQLIQKQWFISYICEYLKNAQEMLPEQREEGYLDYQIEYIIGGKVSDGENLKQVIQELMLLREGYNYVFLMTHPDYTEQAEALAMTLAGVTLNSAIIEGIKQLILFGWAYGESVVEVRQLLEGYELSVIKSEEDWQVPLKELLSLVSNPERYDVPVREQQGISYEMFLRIFMTTQSWQTLAMRALDVIEGETRMMEGCEKLHLDHCIEKLSAQVWMEGIYLERMYGYE